MIKIFNEKNKEVIIHLVSDSTAETINRVVEATMAQFPSIERKELVWPLIRTLKQIKDTLREIEMNPGLVVLSILNSNNKRELEEGCKKIGVPYISPLDQLFDLFKKTFSLSQQRLPGGQHRLNQEYFSRISALDYAMQHDDGQNIVSMNEADIILVGVSRTSKTPTSIYLANKGIKVANLPLVNNIEIPKEFDKISNPVIVGLLIDPRSLARIRETRLRTMGEKNKTTYSSLDKVKNELSDARQLFKDKNWPIVDISRKSVEETAASIMQLLKNK